MNNLWEIINKIPNFEQRQDSLSDQLEDLIIIANKLGFYDAADFLINCLNLG